MFSSEEQIATEYHLNNTFGITLLILALFVLMTTIRANYYKIGHEKITDFWYEDKSVGTVEVGLEEVENFGMKVLVYINGNGERLCNSVGVTLKNDDGDIDFKECI